MQQDHLVEELRPLEDDTGEDVGPVGIAEPDDAARPGGLRLLRHEGGHRPGAGAEVVHVVAALALPAEEPQRAHLGHVATGCHDAGARQQAAQQRNELALVTAGSVKAEGKHPPRGQSFGMILVLAHSGPPSCGTR